MTISVPPSISSFLNSLLSIFTGFTINVVDGIINIPITQMNVGAAFTGMANAINYPDSSGNYHTGNPFGGTNTLTPASYTAVPMYMPGGVAPPRSFPTSQQNSYVVPLGMNPASVYQMSSEALRVLKMFEGCHQRPYVINGVTYIGYGHQLASGDTTAYVSIDQANSMLAADVSAVQGLVQGAVSGHLAQGQFDALTDFAYTLSASAFQASAVLQQFNAGNIGGAATALAQSCYTQQNGIVARSLHLTSRRTHNVHWMTMPVNPLAPT